MAYTEKESPISGTIVFRFPDVTCFMFGHIAASLFFFFKENNSEMTSYVILVDFFLDKSFMFICRASLRILSSGVWNGAYADFISRIFCSSRQPGRTTLCKEW